MFVQPNHDRKPLDELNAIVDEDLIDQLQRDDKDHPVGGKFIVEMIRIIKGDRLQKAK